MSVAPQPAAPIAPPVAPPAEPALSIDRALDRSGKLTGLVTAVLAVLLSLAGGYAAWSVDRAKSVETRQMVVELRRDFDAAEKRDAEFRGEMRQSVQAIREGVGLIREDLRERAPARPGR